MAFHEGNIRDDIKILVEESPMDDNRYNADKILPPLPVKASSGKIPVLPASEGMKNLDLDKAPGGTFKRTTFSWGDDTYTTSHAGIEIPIDKVEAENNSDIFDEEVVAGRIALSSLKISREFKVANAVFNTTTFSGTNDQHAVTTFWTDAANAKAWTDVDEAANKLKAKTGREKFALSLVLPEPDFRAIMRSDEVRADVKYTKDIGSASSSAKASYLADYFGIKEVIVVSTSYDSTPEGYDQASFSEIWTPEFAMLAYINGNGISSWRIPSLGRQPVWSKITNDYIMDSYDVKESISRVIRARDYRGQKVFSRFGTLLTGLHA